MKFYAFLASLVSGFWVPSSVPSAPVQHGSSQMTPAMNPMMTYLFMDKMEGASSIKKLMLLQSGVFGQQSDAQLNQLMPLLLLDADSGAKSKMLMMTMMQNPHTDMNQILPYLLLEDKVDMETLFMMTSMMKSNCDPTNQQMNNLLPMLMFDDEASSKSNLKTMLLMQTMSEGKFRNFDLNFFFALQ